MAKAIRVHAYTKQVSRYLKTVEKRIVPSVVASSLTGTARFMRRETIKRTSQDTKVPSAAIRTRIRASRAFPKKRSKASVYVNKKDLPYHKIKHRQGPRGVNVSGIGRVPRAWVDQRRNLIFQRELEKKAQPIDVPHIKIWDVADGHLRQLQRGEAFRFFKREYNKRLEKRLRKGNGPQVNIALASAKIKDS